MHRTCHASATVHRLRSTLGAPSEPQVHQLLDNLADAHHQWRARRIVRKGDDNERRSELEHKVNIDRDGSSRQPTHGLDEKSGTTESGFFDYTPVRIFNPFFASRLNNWRAIRLHISLIRDPMWGIYDGSRFVCALDLCRTYAALGAERNFLGAEKAVGLYLAGVVFGGPDMYTVSPFPPFLTIQKESQWVLEQLEEIRIYYPIALTLGRNLKRIWELKGNYWEAMRIVGQEQNW
jgi:hypothetical protein